MFKKIKIDKYLVFCLFIFFIISIMSIYSASMYLSKSLGNLVIKQSLWYIVGIVFIFIIMKFKIKIIYDYAWYIYLIHLILLAGLLLIGPVINGSRCWYVINGVGSFQPSEFMKISLILILSKMIDSYKNNYKDLSILNEFKLICLILLIVLLPSVLTFLEPDTGAVLIYLIITFFMLFVSGIRMRWFVLLFIFIALFLSVFLSIYFFLRRFIY